MIDRAAQMPNIITPRVITTASATLTGADMAVICKGTANQTITLPSAAAYAQRVMHIKQRTAFRVTINRAGSDTIDGATSHVMVADGSAVALYSTGSEWLIIGSDLWIQDTTRVWQDVPVSITTSNALGANAPTLTRLVRDSGGTSTGVYAFLFPNNVSKEVFFTIQLPHGYVNGTDIVPHIHWSAENHTSTGTVRWGLEYAISTPAAVIPTTTTILLDIPVDTTVSGADRGKQLMSNFAAITGTGMVDSSLIMCRLYRDVTVGSNLGVGAFALSFDFHIQLENYGSIAQNGD